tara:strand:+ start:489 stop:1133 length:645 start_codon:yes stop_codon:yes gene_type:complete
MTEKTEKWKSAVAGSKYKIDSKKILVRNFDKPKSKIVGAAGSYFLKADSDIESGEVIEEVPVLVSTSTSSELKDPILRHYGSEYPVLTKEFEEEGYPIMFPLGNYPLYKKQVKYNCVYNFNEFFNTLTIRAAVDLKEGDVLILPEDEKIEDVNEEDLNMSKNKPGGCGCGKKEKPEKERARKKREQEKNKKENIQFKSMVDGKLNLKSIEVNND